MRENRVRTRNSVLNTREIIENEIPLLMKSFLHGAKEKVGEKERNRNLSAQFPRKLEGRSSERLNSNRLDSESQSFIEGRRVPETLRRRRSQVASSLGMTMKEANLPMTSKTVDKESGNRRKKSCFFFSKNESMDGKLFCFHIPPYSKKNLFFCNPLFSVFLKTSSLRL